MTYIASYKSMYIVYIKIMLQRNDMFIISILCFHSPKLSHWLYVHDFVLKDSIVIALIITSFPYETKYTLGILLYSKEINKLALNVVT